MVAGTKGQEIGQNTLSQHPRRYLVRRVL